VPIISMSALLKLNVGYQPEKTKKPHSWCDTHLFEEREQPCFGLKAPPVDELVAQQVLRALEPAAVDLSLQAATDSKRERERLHQHWRQRLERAQYESQRVERQYQSVEPENRLVARTLEQRWDESLRLFRNPPVPARSSTCKAITVAGRNARSTGTSCRRSAMSTTCRKPRRPARAAAGGWTASARTSRGNWNSSRRSWKPTSTSARNTPAAAVKRASVRLRFPRGRSPGASPGRVWSPEERRPLRVAEAIPVLDKIQASLAELARRALPKSSLAKAVTYARNQWAALRRYTEDGGLMTCLGYRSIGGNACVAPQHEISSLTQLASQQADTISQSVEDGANLHRDGLWNLLLASLPIAANGNVDAPCGHSVGTGEGAVRSAKNACGGRLFLDDSAPR